MTIGRVIRPRYKTQTATFAGLEYIPSNVRDLYFYNLLLERGLFSHFNLGDYLDNVKEKLLRIN